MSSDTSSPDTTRSASEIRQDIADYVLKQTDELSDVPSVKEFVDDHGRLTKEIAEAKERQERLAKAKEEYQPLEQRVGPCRRSLKDAETKLAKRYAPLGEAAFKALLADDIDEQPLFADRLAAHKRVQVLQAECDALLPGVSYSSSGGVGSLVSADPPDFSDSISRSSVLIASSACPTITAEKIVSKRAGQEWHRSPICL
jgi:hypothetical protein